MGLFTMFNVFNKKVGHMNIRVGFKLIGTLCGRLR